GASSAKNLFFEVTKSGDTIALGAGGVAATLTSTLGSGGRISLIADALSRDPASTITATAGTVEIAPFTNSVSMSLGGTSQPVQVDSTLLSNISTGTLVAGQFTDGNAISITAAGITLDGAVNLTGKANVLFLATLGSITEPTGPLTVATLTGTAGASGTGAVSLGIIGNSVGTLAGFTATGGDFSLASTGP